MQVATPELRWAAGLSVNQVKGFTLQDELEKKSLSFNFRGMF